MVTATGVYPEYREQIERLVEQHKENFGDRLKLSVCYAPEHMEAEGDVFLFEVLTDFESGSLEEQNDILEVIYGSTPAFPLEGRDSRLHILLTNPDELQEAKRKNTRLYRELKNAYSKDRAQEIHSNNLSLTEALR